MGKPFPTFNVALEPFELGNYEHCFKILCQLMIVIVEIAVLVVFIEIEERTCIKRPIQASHFTGFEAVGVLDLAPMTGLCVFMFPECVKAGTWS